MFLGQVSGFRRMPNMYLSNVDRSLKESEAKFSMKIQGLELEENTLTGIERIRKITKELGLVETTKKIERA